MGYTQNNPLPRMKSALKMMKADKKMGVHRDSAMQMGHESPTQMGHSPMEMGHESAELKDMPIIDIEKGKAKGSPAKAAKPDYIDIDKDGNTTESMKDAAKAKGSPAKKQGYNDKLDESLAKDGKESSKKQSMKDRRDESKGEEKSKGKGAYSSDSKMS